MILAIKTDNPITELYLLKTDGSELAKDVWESGNQLSLQLLSHIKSLLEGKDSQMNDLTGIVVYEGPGSFTGLRIGITVANTIAYSENLPIAVATDENWLNEAREGLKDAKPGGQVLPKYGAEANITKPKK